MSVEVKAQNTTTLASVKAIYDAADEANTLLDGMQAAATAAGTTLNDIYQDAADAQTAADTAQQAADTALVNLATTENVVGVLNWITAHGTMTLTSDVTVNPAHVYFIVDPAGDYVVGGTHYSIVSEPDDADISTYYELSVDESVENYVATHIVVDSEGLWIIPDAGGNKVLIATGSGSTYTTAGTYIVGTGNVTLASFTANGVQIGQTTSGNYAVVDNNSFDVYHENTKLVHFGYVSSPLNAPYYTLGERLANSATGSYSLAEGINVTASGLHSHAEGTGTISSGASSHAEGSSTTASGFDSHAEGSDATASGDYSHAEGRYSTASGSTSHAEGFNSDASGLYSHAQNCATKASSNSQTAIGKFNVEDSADTYAVIVGNGTDYNARSNALTVDWSGNVEAAGGVTDGSGNTLSTVASTVSGLTTIETYTLPNTTYVNDSIIKKCGNIVSIYIKDFKNLPQTTLTTIGTLPVGWRPASQMNIDDINANSPTKVYRLVINTTGVMQLYNYSTATGSTAQNASIHCTYIATQ